jgi:N-acetylglucosaminyldiphosphoundecaprenol N-acetyl-beta-D-mannosaminyltransferase
VTASSRDAPPRVDILGVGIHAINMPVALDRIAHWIESGEQHYVCVTGVHGVMESQHDPELRAIHNASGLTTPDGRPLVWAGKYAGAKDMQQVCGPELLPQLCAVAATRGWRAFLYGGAPQVAELLRDRLVAAFPGLQITGTYTPPFRELTPDEDEEIVELINAAEPDIVWVGLSTPKQERWMAAHVRRVRASVLVGVGAAFDIHAGLRRQPPSWIRRSGLEWAYRLAVEPRRLGPRYLRSNPRFVWNIWRRPPHLLEQDESLENG